MSNSTLIAALRQKIAAIIADNRLLRQQAAELRRSEDKLRGEKGQLQERIAELEARLNVLELSQSISGGDVQDRKQAKARINRLMREVDRCIALLNR